MKQIKASELSAIDLYEQGRVIEKEAHDSQEIHKVGTLRGGSTGCITPFGDVYGKCHRIAFARYKGLQPQIEKTSFVWFDAGYANEDAWLQKLTKTVDAMGDDYTLKSEEDCPIKWEIDGVKVTGRPDLMIYNKDEAILGLELKVVCAVKSAINVYCEDKPKIDNLLQAAHYSMEHNCPFNLVYSYRSRSFAPSWASRYADKLTVIEKVFPAKKKKDGTYGKPFVKRDYQLEPFIKEFKIGFEDDHVYYIKEDGTKVITQFTAEGIRKYYGMIVDMDKNKHLYTRVSQKDLFGEILPYNPCNYCEFSDACEDNENDYDAWLDKVALICEEEK